MNGTVLPSSRSAMTAATPFAGSPRVSTSAGTGSKSSFVTAVSGVAASSVMRPANLAPAPCPGKAFPLGDGSKYVRGQRRFTGRFTKFARQHSRDLHLECIRVDATFDELIEQRISADKANRQVVCRYGRAGLHDRIDPHIRESRLACERPQHLR